MLRKESTISHFKNKQQQLAAKKKTDSKDSKDSKIVKDNRKASNSKDTWKKFLQEKRTKEILKKSWEADRPKQKFNQIIKQLSTEFKNKKK